MEVSVDPTLSISTKSEVVCVEFCPYEWSKHLLAVALSNALNIYSVKFQVGINVNILLMKPIQIYIRIANC